jgi:hypothetical protein
MQVLRRIVAVEKSFAPVRTRKDYFRASRCAHHCDGQQYVSVTRRLEWAYITLEAGPEGSPLFRVAVTLERDSLDDSGWLDDSSVRQGNAAETKRRFRHVDVHLYSDAGEVRGLRFLRMFKPALEKHCLESSPYVL